MIGPYNPWRRFPRLHTRASTRAASVHGRRDVARTIPVVTGCAAYWQIYEFGPESARRRRDQQRWGCCLPGCLCACMCGNFVVSLGAHAGRGSGEKKFSKCLSRDVNASKSKNQPTNQPTKQTTKPTNQPNKQPTYQPNNPANQPDLPTNQPTNQSTKQTHKPTNQPNPTNQTTNQPPPARRIQQPHVYAFCRTVRGLPQNHGHGPARAHQRRLRNHCDRHARHWSVIPMCCCCPCGADE